MRLTFVLTWCTYTYPELDVSVPTLEGKTLVCNHRNASDDIKIEIHTQWLKSLSWSAYSEKKHESKQIINELLVVGYETITLELYDIHDKLSFSDKNTNCPIHWSWYYEYVKWWSNFYWTYVMKVSLTINITNIWLVLMSTLRFSLLYILVDSVFLNSSNNLLIPTWL